MNARRIDPTVRNPRFGLNELPTPSRKIVFITHSGLHIGCRHVPSPPSQDHGTSADRVQALLLWGRPLWQTQRYVAAMCTAERRP